MLNVIKQQLVDLFIKFNQQEKVKSLLIEQIQDASVQLPKLRNETQPYFAISQRENALADRDDIVFINSRFRSGSTLLWNIFRQTELCTSYYEPFNERQWFNQALRGSGVDDSHRGVDDYWAEYDGLEALSHLYNERWIDKNLMMSAQCWAPQMQLYIEKMVKTAPKRPVLQFNRIDFRLPWLRTHFPNAKFIHLYRHPRDQWCSFLTNPVVMNKHDVQNTYVDAFYLDVWCNDLSKHYPFLSKIHTPHPYQRFYYLWKLSYLFGKAYCHHSLSFEALNQSPRQQLELLFSAISLKGAPIDKLCEIIKSPTAERWREYADEQWFSEHEAICEQNLTKWLSPKAL
jgi:hypothetical protein